MGVEAAQRRVAAIIPRPVFCAAEARRRSSGCPPEICPPVAAGVAVPGAAPQLLAQPDAVLGRLIGVTLTASKQSNFEAVVTVLPAARERRQR